MNTHYWIRSGRRRDRDRLRAGLDLPPVLAVVDAHRRLRGPYSAAGALLREIGPDLLHRLPELGTRHHIEILSAAPEFAGQVPPIKATLELTGNSGVRTRYQARVHTLRIAHGLADLLRDYLGGRRALVVENLDEADPTDQEFLAVLLTRLTPDQLTVIVGTSSPSLPDPPGPVAISCGRVLSVRTTIVDAVATEGAVEGADLAQAYVESDGTEDDPRYLAAYEGLDPDRRAALHDARAAALTANGEPSLLLGAVPYHLERGSNPSGDGAAAIRAAQLRCKSLGLYHAAAELGERGRRLVDVETRAELWWDITGDMTTSLAAIGRAEEAEAYYDELRTVTTDPEHHMHLAYGTAMLYARHYGDERRDPRRARAWLNLAVAISSHLPDPKERAFYTVFNRNGTALVDVREGRYAHALERLNEGMARLDRELEPDEYLLHRAGLRYNRAQVYMINGRLAEALADFDYVIEHDPNFHDHYFNRGNILGRLGRHREAIADYDQALRLSPPFVEAYYNRGDARLELDDVDGALADFSRVIELEPGHAGARLHRGSILCDRDDIEAAWSDVTVGLTSDPGNAYLWCLKGRILAERGESGAAWSALTEALRLDEGLAEAYAVRAGLAFDEGDLADAIRDLDQAVALRGTVEMRFNRAVVYQAAARFSEAAADYEAVLTASGDPEAQQGWQACQSAIALHTVA
jgi:tetratricopeptide (TPR) repeat protein